MYNISHGKPWLLKLIELDVSFIEIFHAATLLTVILLTERSRQLVHTIEHLICFRWTIHRHEKHTQQHQNQQFFHSSLSVVPAARCLSRCAFSKSGYEIAHGSVPAVVIIRWQSCAICERKSGSGMSAVYFSMSADFLYLPLWRHLPHENWTTSNG